MSAKSRDATSINLGIQRDRRTQDPWKSTKRRVQRPATEMMLDLAEIRLGSRVLDLAAGTGDQTVLVAQRVGPTGYVLATDISASMLKLAADAGTGRRTHEC